MRLYKLSLVPTLSTSIRNSMQTTKPSSTPTRGSARSCSNYSQRLRPSMPIRERVRPRTSLGGGFWSLVRRATFTTTFWFKIQSRQSPSRATPPKESWGSTLQKTTCSLFQSKKRSCTNVKTKQSDLSSDNRRAPKPYSGNHLNFKRRSRPTCT